jgi:hypothetical protein
MSGKKVIVYGASGYTGVLRSFGLVMNPALTRPS